MGDSGTSRILLAPGLFLALLAPLAARGAAPLYTNEDLDRLSPLPVQAAPLAQDSPEDWRFVLDMLDRERNRLDIERTLQLERDRHELLTREVEERDHDHFSYPYVYGAYGAYGAYGRWGNWSRRPGFVRPPLRPMHVHGAPPSAPGPRPVPRPRSSPLR